MVTVHTVIKESSVHTDTGVRWNLWGLYDHADLVCSPSSITSTMWPWVS